MWRTQVTDVANSQHVPRPQRRLLPLEHLLVRLFRIPHLVNTVCCHFGEATPGYDVFLSATGVYV